MKYCSKCGSALTDDAIFCSTCGNKVGGSQTAPTPAPAPVQQTTVVQANTQQPKKKNAFDVLGVLALIAAIFTFVLAPYLYVSAFASAVLSSYGLSITMFSISELLWVFSFVFSIIGIKKAARRGKCITGLVFSCVSFVVNIVPLIVFIIVLAEVGFFVGSIGTGYSSSYNGGYGYYLALASLL